MIGFRRLAALTVVVTMGCLASAPLMAEEISNPAAPAQVDNAEVLRRMAELEKEVQRLRGELQAVKSAPIVSPSLVPAVYSPQAAAATPGAAPAAAAKPSPLDGLASVLNGATFTGLVDTYYSYNANQPDFAAFGGRTSALRLFDARTNQFALQLVELGLVKTPDADNRLGYKAVLGFGDAMNVVNGGDPSFLQHLKEVYFSYLAPVGKGLQIDVGKFVTPNGAEVIETNANWNYSRSLLFNFAIPFYHYGLRAQYTFSPKFALTGYVVNGWNNVVHDTLTPINCPNFFTFGGTCNNYTNSGKTGGLSAVWTATKKLTFTENWMGGPGALPADGDHWRNLFDTVIAYNPTAKLSLQANVDYGRVEGTLLVPNRSQEWWGGAAYIKYQFNPRWAVATRYEYYNDPDGFTTAILDPNGHGPHVQEITATLERRIASHLISRFEYRHDQSNQAFFPEGKATNPAVKDQNTLAVGLVFVLEPSESK